MLSGRIYAAAAVFSTVLALVACGGGGGGAIEPIAVTFASPPPAALSISDTASLTALVANDSARAGVAWTLSCAASDCGSLNPATTPSGIATAYIPPAALPSPAGIKIIATSVADQTKSVSGTIELTAAAGPALADGTYVFHLSGLDANGAYYLAGAFTVSNGVITG